jgi:hypothetical protein
MSEPIATCQDLRSYALNDRAFGFNGAANDNGSCTTKFSVEHGDLGIPFHCEAQKIHRCRDARHHRSCTRRCLVIKLTFEDAQILHTHDTKRMSFLLANWTLDDALYEKAVPMRTAVASCHDLALPELKAGLPLDVVVAGANLENLLLLGRDRNLVT